MKGDAHQATSTPSPAASPSTRRSTHLQREVLTLFSIQSIRSKAQQPAISTKALEHRLVPRDVKGLIVIPHIWTANIASQSFVRSEEKVFRSCRNQRQTKATQDLKS